MKPFSFIAKIALICLSSICVFSQTPTPTPNESEGETVKISTNLVQVDVTVTDKDGKIVTDLKPGDLELYENGKKQEITNFSFVQRGGESDLAEKPDKPKPTVGKLTVTSPSVKLRPEQVRRTYTLVVDDLGLNFANVFFVKEALKKFINEQMEAGDLVAIIRTGKTNGALSSFTTDKRQLLAVVDKIKWNIQGRSGISTFEAINLDSVALDPETANATRNDNFAVGTLGVVSQVISGMRELPGRKAVILFSEGFGVTARAATTGAYKNTRALDYLRLLVDLANRSSVVVYTVDPRGLQNSNMFEAQDNLSSFGEEGGVFNSRATGALKDRDDNFIQSQQSLRILAYATGGLAIINQNDINKGLRRVVEDQSSYYLLGYVPDEATFDPNKSKFNNIEVRAVRPGLKVRYRSGFFGITDQKYVAEQKVKENNVAAALSSSFGASDISLDLTSVYINDIKEGNIIRALLNIDAKDLSFTDLPDGGKQTEFGLYAFTFGDNGKILNSLAKVYRVKVSQADYQKMLEKGFVYFADVPFKNPGAYQLRVALQDTKTQKLGAANQFVEIPDLGKNRLTLSGLILQTFTAEEWNSPNASGQMNKTQPTTTTAIRKFKQGNVLQFSYAVYNAGNKAGNTFKSQIRLFRNGQLVFEGKQTPLVLPGNDGKRSQGSGALTLGADIVPGDYALQLIVFDEDAKNKNQIASQSIDFEVTN